jgi:hypothetical protein
MVMVENISNGVDMEIIIISKNIIDPIIIKILRKVIEIKKNKTHEDNKVSTSTFIKTINPPLPTSTKEVNKVTPTISSLEVLMIPIISSSNNNIKAPTRSSSTTMAPPQPPSNNMALSSSSTNLEVYFSPIINYFANIPSDSDELDDEFDSYTIPYPSNFNVNESLPHSKFLAYLDSTKILKDKIIENEKMISIY